MRDLISSRGEQWLPTRISHPFSLFASCFPPIVVNLRMRHGPVLLIVDSPPFSTVFGIERGSENVNSLFVRLVANLLLISDDYCVSFVPVLPFFPPSSL